ncbi:MAG TPA: methyl-accepting chemotaxis protein, partial [Gammaproteobacteria bacterium]|nr:methyl-accepting chemotaxis protein [Gammaproteobacteria bacterium]
YAGRFEKNFETVSADLQALEAAMRANGLAAERAEAVAGVLGNYRQDFRGLVELQRSIGLSHEQGLRGSLRGAVHEAEDRINALGDAELLADMLMLRRNEKDFLMRRLPKYPEKFQRNFAVLEQGLASRPYPPAQKEHIKEAMDRYHGQFLELVAAAKEMGLSHKQGLRGRMRDTVHKTEDLLADMAKDLEAAVAAETAAVKRNNFLAAGVLAALVLGVILYLAWRISTRLDGVARTIEAVRDNNDLGIRVEIGGKDEIAAVGRDFNSMMEAFGGIIHEVTSASSQLSTAAQQLSGVADQSKTGVHSQQRETDGVATAINEMSATVEEIARSTADAAEAAREADDESRHGREVVTAAVTAINQFAREVERADEVMKRLEQETEEVTTILDVIRGIAEQTNLLALNAAIEAARAGEQGRGFAVVADEVRTLAQRTHASTQEIQTMIERLQGESREAAGVMAQGRQQGEESVRQVQATSGSFESIAERVAAINDRNTQVASSSEEQRSVTEEVSRNVTAIKSVTDDTAEGVDQIAASSHELAEVAQRLQATVGRFRG